MRLTCSTNNHEAKAELVRNRGYEFSQCVRCGRDLIRSRYIWWEVPQGFRVVWRRTAPRRTERAAAHLCCDLPASLGAVAIPADRRPGAGRIGLAIELLLLAMICLASAAAERLKSWLMAIRSSAPPRQPI